MSSTIRQKMWDACETPKNLNQIVAATGVPIDSVKPALTKMTKSGQLERVAPGRYLRKGERPGRAPRDGSAAPPPPPAPRLSDALTGFLGIRGAP